MADSYETVKNFHCPRWDELPSIPLYMDQVLLVLNEILQPLSRSKDALVTSAMINNYVKQKLIAPPIKKKYGREQLSRLIIICLLKRVLSISEIVYLFKETDDPALQNKYMLFCDLLESALRQGLEGGISAIMSSCGEKSDAALCAALLSLAGRIYVEFSFQGSAE